MGHRERGGGESGRAQAGGDGEEIGGVFARADAVAQHEVVARALLLGAEAVDGEPRERVEPVKREGELRDEERERIAAAEVASS